MADPEFLVVLDDSDDASHGVMAKLRPHVRHVFSERMVVVAAKDDVALRKLASVRAVVRSDAPRAIDELLPTCTGSERLLAEAWRDRQLVSAKGNQAEVDVNRGRGEGRAWDDPDFEAPDADWARHV